ncbi:MAG: hypothetical protein OEY17_02675 [Nitrosopumilus sp.]|nr:hypothetical protein [Nitrosopumilus sp.]MDH5658235.1 hypothetical protein [Nitrosopumilus sp.]
MPPGRSLTASEITKTAEQKLVPTVLYKPMQDLDYVVIEALLRFTFAEHLMHAYNKFLVGTGFSSELEMINPSNDKGRTN